MQKRQTIIELTIALVFLGLVVFISNPFNLWMPHMMVTIVICILAVLFALYVGLVWREDPQDERESYHTMIASRVGYLVGVGILVSVLFIQSITGVHPDLWLLVVLGGMVIGKIIGVIYSRYYL